VNDIFRAYVNPHCKSCFVVVDNQVNKGVGMLGGVFAATGVLSGVGLLAQQLPGVPKGFQTWPVTAMLALIALTSMYLNFKSSTQSNKTVEKIGDKLGEVAVEMGALNELSSEQARRFDELNGKLGENLIQQATTNERLLGISKELDKRPCITNK